MKKGIPSIPSTDPEFQIHTDILNVTSKDWADDMFLNYKRNNSSSSALSPRRTSVDDSENHMMMWKSYSIDDSVLNKTNIPVSIILFVNIIFYVFVSLLMNFKYTDFHSSAKSVDKFSPFKPTK